MKNLASLKVPIFIALDVDTDREAMEIAQSTKDFAGGFKIGPRICMRYGAPFVQKLAELGSVFIDNKYFDIPSTMEAAVRTSFEAGASFVTVHAQAGSEALTRMTKVEAELCAQRPFRILAVTILTSFSPQTLPPNSNQKSISLQVEELAELAIQCGLTGLVCSPEEVQALRLKFEHAFLVTPGIRMPDDKAGDQKRTSGPREAMQSGASALVIGRPICEAPNKPSAAEKFYEEVKKAKSL